MATIYNLKEMAKTLLYLQENGLADYDALTQASGGKDDKISSSTQYSRHRRRLKRNKR